MRRLVATLHATTGYLLQLCPHSSLVVDECLGLVEAVRRLGRSWLVFDSVIEAFRVACHALVGLVVKLGMEETHSMIACAMCHNPTAPFAYHSWWVAQPKLSAKACHSWAMGWGRRDDDE